MKKILIAEDDNFLANAYSIKLTSEGFEVQLVSNGDEAVKAVKASKPDLIILDLIMPLKDGFSVIEELRADPQYAKLPILVASNLGQVEEVKRAKDLGATDYIVKSQIKLDEIVRKIRSLTGR